MNHWIFIVTNKKATGRTVKAREIFNRRISDKFWGIGMTTPNRKQLARGDKVIFYIGHPETVFGGEATLDSNFFELSEKDKKAYQHDKEIFNASHGVALSETMIWDKPIPVIELVHHLRFIENKDYWYTYFQGGVRQISEDDFTLISSGVPKSLTQELERAVDIENESEFALESHLEEFLAENWNSIQWGAKLELYQTEEQDGRQFPAGLWSIDFLAVDPKDDALVVIELKKGKTSDATVGQILRYMSWVGENIASKGQKVRGIIIAHKVDDALKYAVKNQKMIEVKTYNIQFNLKSHN